MIMSCHHGSLFFYGVLKAMILKGYILSALYGALCLLFAAILHKCGVEKRVTRKTVHILVGFEWVILFRFVGATYHFLIVCLLFLALLVFVYKKRLMPMIASDGENAPGTVYYAVAMSIMATITLFENRMMIPFGIGVFCTSFGDGFAGLVGQSIPRKINPRIYGNKSLFGGAVNLLVCFAVAIFFSCYFKMNLGVIACLAIAVFALELELFTTRGLDNITITLGASVLAFAFSYYPSVWNYIVPILLTPAIIAFVKTKKALSVGGLISAVLLDVAISLTLGNSGFLILLSFFAIGLITDKIKKRADKKRQNQIPIDKSRGAIQVLSNGAVGAVCAVAFFATREKVFLVAFCASFAEALADTAASGIGAFSDKAFDPFRFKRCESGLSGGMSAVGTLASLVGAFLIAIISLGLNLATFNETIIIAFVGFVGGVFDSLLGSLLQVKYRCKVCSKIIEKNVHCDEKADHYRGLKFLDNNLVNFFGTLFSAIIAFIFTI